jgi:hypothetical protein
MLRAMHGQRDSRLQEPRKNSSLFIGEGILRIFASRKLAFLRNLRPLFQQFACKIEEKSPILGQSLNFVTIL